MKLYLIKVSRYEESFIHGCHQFSAWRVEKKKMLEVRKVWFYSEVEAEPLHSKDFTKEELKDLIDEKDL